MLTDFITQANSCRGFMFAYLENKALLKGGLFLKERICSWRSKFFPLRVDPPSRKEAKVKMEELLPLTV